MFPEGVGEEVDDFGAKVGGDRATGLRWCRRGCGRSKVF